MLDVDGVLIDGRPSDGQFWTHTLQEDLGIDPAELVQEFFLKDWLSIVTGERDLLPSLSEALGRFASHVTAEEFVSYWFKMDSRIVDQVLSDCEAARQRGMRIYLATNQEHLRAQYLMNTLGLQSTVDGIIYSAQVGAKKPAADFYRYATKVAGVSPDEIVFVDDTLGNVEAARRSGWQGAHWGEGSSLSDILQHHDCL